MSFLHYLMLGISAYACGFVIRYYIYKNKLPNQQRIYQFTAGFFIIMLLFSYLLNLWVLGNSTPDFAFIGVSSTVATFIFYQGLNPDQNTPMPH